MKHSTRPAGAAIVAALAFAVGTGSAAAGPAEGPAATEAGTVPATGWVVENPRPDGLYDTYEGSATVGLANGATITCSVVDGWGRAESETLRPDGYFAGTGVTAYQGCTGPGAADVQVFSSPDMVFVADTYDPATDRITGVHYAWVWGLFLDAPDCQIDLYPVDPNGEAAITYDNRTKTLDTSPLAVVATRADGAGCAGLAQVGDELTFETTFVATPGFTVRPA